MFESESVKQKQAVENDNTATTRPTSSVEVAQLSQPVSPRSESREVGTNQLVIKPGGGYTLSFRADEREDRLAKSDQTHLPDGSIRTELTFKGRQDGLLSQTSTVDRSGRDRSVSQFSDGRRIETDRQFGQILATRSYDRSGNLIVPRVPGSNQRDQTPRAPGSTPRDSSNGTRSEPTSISPVPQSVINEPGVLKPGPGAVPRENGSTPRDSQRPGDQRPDRQRPGDQLPDQQRPGDRRPDQQRPVIEVRAGESIQRALERAPEGAIVHVQPGVYRERLNINRDNITLKGDGRAVLDLENTSVSGGAIRIANRRNVTIDGFEIRNVRGGDTPTGIAVEGTGQNISLINNNIHHVESGKDAHGISVYGTQSAPIKNVRIEGNRVHHLRLGTSEAVVINGNVETFKILGNKVHDNDNIGIDVIGGERVGGRGQDRARDGLIANNEVYNIDLSGKRFAAGIYVDGGSDVTIEDNVVRNSTYGIELASERGGWDTERIKVRRNRVSDTRLAGVTLGGGTAGNGGVVDSVVENNDLRGNRRPIWEQNNVRGVTIRNNRQ
jgi:parallel beta-helix repeat protein